MSSGHTRNTIPMLASKRCGAKTRRSSLCRSPAVRGKMRCRMHGGAAGSGAPPGNANALRSGAYTREYREKIKEGRQALRSFRDFLRKLE